MKQDAANRFPGPRVCRSILGVTTLALLCVCVALSATAVRAQSQEPANASTIEAPATENPAPAAQATAAPAAQQAPDAELRGRINGTVTDPSEAILVGAAVVLTSGDPSQPPVQKQETTTRDDGQFFFTDVAPGPFQLTISYKNFLTQTFSGTLEPAGVFITPPISLAIKAEGMEVKVKPQEEIAAEQIKEQEQQRVLGFIPNYYVSYLPDAVPLTNKQKFGLAWRSSTDPFTFLTIGIVAGAQQAGNAFSGYGQGFQGYAKRYGASYADVVTGTFIGGAILPSAFKQDPRYFYKGQGSFGSRLLYAIGNSVYCKSDSGKWQPNYSNVLGAFATGGIASFYYPSSSTNKSNFVLSIALIRIGETMAAGVFQEFVVRHLTPNLPKRQSPPTP